MNGQVWLKTDLTNSEQQWDGYTFQNWNDTMTSYKNKFFAMSKLHAKV